MATQAHPPGTVLMRPMLDPLARNWGFIMFRGILAILFGILTFAWPGLTLLTLVIFYGVYVLFDGGTALVAALTKGAPAPRWWLALVGLLGLAVGVMTLLWPGITGLILLYFIAGWSIASGILQIVGAIRLRKEVEGEWLLIVSGILAVLFGLLIMAFPAAGALGLAFAIGAFAIVEGVLMVAFSLRLRKLAAVKI